MTKSLMRVGVSGFLLLSGAMASAQDVNPASNEQIVAEAVDCFYEYNQGESLCQEIKKSERSKRANTVIAGKSSTSETTTH